MILTESLIFSHKFFGDEGTDGSTLTRQVAETMRGGRRRERVAEQQSTYKKVGVGGERER